MRLDASELETLTACVGCGGADLEPLFPTERVQRCRACRLVFHNPRPTTAAIVRYYDSLGKYDHWLDELAGREQMWRARLELVRRAQPSGRLLDVGAGIGQFLSLARQHFQVSGTEVSSEAIAVARETYEVELVQGTLDDALPFEDGAFDAVTMIHVLEHVPSPRDTVRVCCRLLRPGGHLFVAVPNDSAVMQYKAAHQAPRAAWAAILGGLGDDDYRAPGVPPFPRLDLDAAATDDEVHLSHFHAASLAGLLEREGFEVVLRAPDPVYPSAGAARLVDDLKCGVWRLAHALTGADLWGALFVGARRR